MHTGGKDSNEASVKNQPSTKIIPWSRLAWVSYSSAHFAHKASLMWPRMKRKMSTHLDRWANSP